MVPAGYMAKHVCKTPDWLNANHVVDIYSVSGCVSEDFADYIKHPPRRPTELRTAHFPKLETLALFVSGTRDGFGTIEEIAAALKLIPARTQLVTIEGAGHELMSKRNAEEVPAIVRDAFGAFFG